MDHLDRPDALHFVGGISAERLVLQQVIATAALVEQARQSADTVVIDTTGVISGVGGETLKYHKMELCRPEAVVALQRGGELEPVVGMLRRFFGAQVITAPVEPDVLPSSPDDRAGRRSARFETGLCSATGEVAGQTDGLCSDFADRTRSVPTRRASGRDSRRRRTLSGSRSTGGR